MRFRSIVVAVVLAVISSLATWHLASAQQDPDWLQSGITSGADIGFRVERVRGNIASGRLMVRVKGRWLEAGPSEYPSTRQLSER